MSIPIFQVDAFASGPFTGNPAAVCILDAPRDATWMQNVAMEMNLSETAFIDPSDDGWNLRWFTPTVEVDLCGHATLATAHALWESKRLKDDEPARFHTKSGLLTCARSRQWIEMDFPATFAELAPAPDGLLAALGISRPVAVARSKFDYLVELDSDAQVRSLAPDFAQMRKVQARGVIVTAKAARDFDFISRFFAPGSGIDEDPVTGSAHCCLAPWWRAKLRKDSMLAYQASRRGGVVRVTVAGSRVLLGGQAVTTLRGELV